MIAQRGYCFLISPTPNPNLHLPLLSPPASPSPKTAISAADSDCFKSPPSPVILLLPTLPPKSKEMLHPPCVVPSPPKLPCSPPSLPPRRLLPQPCVVVLQRSHAHCCFPSRRRGYCMSFHLGCCLLPRLCSSKAHKVAKIWSIRNYSYSQFFHDCHPFWRIWNPISSVVSRGFSSSSASTLYPPLPPPPPPAPQEDDDTDYVDP
ncbi:hypothetical protein PIB30_058283 [Stylosanthes scabra]|uniref:Uncharacterized protein n=1 Tax=Stylosanthes scabra TaxID=79078 RepID=A0ABU6WJJ3_9FABA|nr:hypothetical protein [Stylosanthes scabra]